MSIYGIWWNSPSNPSRADWCSGYFIKAKSLIGNGMTQFSDINDAYKELDCWMRGYHIDSPNEYSVKEVI